MTYIIKSHAPTRLLHQHRQEARKLWLSLCMVILATWLSGHWLPSHTYPPRSLWTHSPLRHPDMSAIAECLTATKEAGIAKNSCRLLSRFWTYADWTGKKRKDFTLLPCFKTNFSSFSLNTHLTLFSVWWDGCSSRQVDHIATCYSQSRGSLLLFRGIQTLK